MIVLLCMYVFLRYSCWFGRFAELAASLYFLSSQEDTGLPDNLPGAKRVIRYIKIPSGWVQSLNVKLYDYITCTILNYDQISFCMINHYQLSSYMIDYYHDYHHLYDQRLSTIINYYQLESTITTYYQLLLTAINYISSTIITYYHI